MPRKTEGVTTARNHIRFLEQGDRKVFGHEDAIDKAHLGVHMFCFAVRVQKVRGFGSGKRVVQNDKIAVANLHSGLRIEIRSMQEEKSEVLYLACCTVA